MKFKSIFTIVASFLIATTEFMSGSIVFAEEKLNTTQMQENDYGIVETLSPRFTYIESADIGVYPSASGVTYSMNECDKAVYAQQIDIISGNTAEQKRIMEEFYNEKHNLENKLISLKGYIEKGDIDGIIENLDIIIKNNQYAEKISTCAVRFYNYTTKLGAQIQ